MIGRKDVPVIKSDVEERVLQLRRVSKKTKGGNTIKFAALVVVGNKDGKVGAGYSKARDVASAIQKSVAQAKRNMITIKMADNTISHPVTAKYDSAKVLLKPAPKGTGIIAGGPIRTVVELSGIKDISAKMIGANNKISNVRCTIEALRKLKG